MKITTRCGSEVIGQLNKALLAKAAQAKLLRVGKVRAATTVVSTTIDYPTDLTLLTRAARRIGRIARRVKADSAATRARCPDHSRAASRGARQIASKLRLRGPQTNEEAERLIAHTNATAAVGRLAQSGARDAEAVLRNAHRALRTATGRRAGRLRRGQRASRHHRGHHHRGSPGAVPTGRGDAPLRDPGSQSARP
jgi:transposase, IS5 family